MNEQAVEGAVLPWQGEFRLSHGISPFMLRFSKTHPMLRCLLLLAFSLMSGWMTREAPSSFSSAPVLAPQSAGDLSRIVAQDDDSGDEANDNDLLVRESDQDDDRAPGIQSTFLYQPRRPSAYSSASESQKAPAHLFVRARSTRSPPC